MYTDKYGRTWEGPYPFSGSAISTHAPRDFGVYQIVYPGGAGFEVAYIGIATGDSIFGRLNKHCSGVGNVHLGSLGNPDNFMFIFYRCDGETAKQIESHVITTSKPPFNVKPEYKHFIPSIYIH